MNRGYAAVGLYSPIDNENVASALRACGCYDVKLMAISGSRYRKHGANTSKWDKHMPFLQVDDLKSVIPYNCVPVAVDLLEDAEPLQTYVHPERAFYIFGPENSTLGKQITSFCRDKIYIPTRQCMNLAATVNVVLYDRLAKSLAA